MGGEGIITRLMDDVTNKFVPTNITPHTFHQQHRSLHLTNVLKARMLDANVRLGIIFGGKFLAIEGIYEQTGYD